MANYANSRGFAGAFNNLTGILNMFLQNQMNRSNIEDDRKYQDETYEKKLIDSRVENALKLLNEGKIDAYGTYQGDPISNGTRKVNILGVDKVVPVATPQKVIDNKIDNIDYSNIADLLKSGAVVTRPNQNAIKNSQNNLMITLTKKTAEAMKKGYDIDFNEGDVVPYNMLAGAATLAARNQQIASKTEITQKEAIDKLIRMQKNLNPQGLLTPDETLELLIQDPTAVRLLQISGDYDKALQRVDQIRQERNNNNENENKNGGFLKELYKKVTGNKQKNENNSNIRTTKSGKKYTIEEM